MKIFSWVHKTFHHSSLKDGFDSSNVIKAEPDVMKCDKNGASLKEVDDIWKDGFLTIGTLGCYQHNDFLDLERDEDDEAEEENKYGDSEQEEMKPLIRTKFENNFEDVGNYEKPNNAAEVEADLLTPTPTLVSYDDNVVECCIHVGTDQKEVKKGDQRITLAELFLADSEKIIKHVEAAKFLFGDDDKQSLTAKHGKPTFAKKLISRVNKENAPPIKIIRKLMKKMIKKKIHPDVDVKNNQKSEGQKPSASESVRTKRLKALLVNP